MKHDKKIVIAVLFLAIVLIGKQHIQSTESHPINNFLQTIPEKKSSSPNINSEQLPLNNSCAQYDPVVVLTLMVKDEEHVIVQTLKPYVEGGINAVLLFDTGSTDKTMEVAQKYLEQQKANFYIVQEPFIDFATSRNRGLELAREKFPNAGFLIMPDAEWYLHNAPKLIEYCKEQLSTHPQDSYMLRIMSPQLDFYTQRLIKANTPIKFVGVVHETLNVLTQTCVPLDVYFELGSTKQGYEKSKKRWERDKVLLLNHLNENPNDPRTAFYLAQTHDCLGELEDAYKYYKVRNSILGWSEENFMTVYRLAQVTERLADQKNNKYSWDEALGYYLESFAMRPCRAEPLIKVSQHYLAQGQHELSYLFARRAAEINYPDKDVLFVEKEAYEYIRHDVLGQCGWYVQSFEIGESAVRNALKAHPDYQHLKNNLTFYEKRKNSSEKTT